jgi:hypothetical protein
MKSVFNTALEELEGDFLTSSKIMSDFSLKNIISAEKLDME